MDASDYECSDVMSLRTNTTTRDRFPVAYHIEVAKRTTDIDGRVSEAAWTCKSYAMHPVKYYGLFPASRLYRSFGLFSTHIGLKFRAMINKALLAALAAGRDSTLEWQDNPFFRNGVRRPCGRTEGVPPKCNTGANQRACFECGVSRHFKKDADMIA
ncbi:hypothetical protein Tco_0324790 [Tanacetum coccineum]